MILMESLILFNYLGLVYENAAIVEDSEAVIPKSGLYTV